MKDAYESVGRGRGLTKVGAAELRFFFAKEAKK